MFDESQILNAFLHAKAWPSVVALEVSSLRRQEVGTFLSQQGIKKGRDYRRVDWQFGMQDDIYNFRRDEHAVSLKLWL